MTGQITSQSYLQYRYNKFLKNLPEKPPRKEYTETNQKIQTKRDIWIRQMLNNEEIK